jgi:endonuclease I
MKKVFAHLITLVLVLSVLTPAVRADVLLSELCDPREDYLTDRFIEIFNSGSGSVDLTGWQIVAVGNSSDIFTWNLSGTIAPGQALVAGDQTTTDIFPVDFPDEAWSNNNSTWNGKIGDGARLKNGSGVIIDDAVVPTTVFENKTLERNDNISSPSPSYNAGQWTATPVDAASDATPGTHHDIQASGPVIAMITTIPAIPESNEPVDVEAIVTDDAATITSVVLNWGTISGYRPNAIDMIFTGGATYATLTPVPAQAEGVTVYFAITATNDVPVSTVSPENSYGSGAPPGYYDSAEGLIGVPLQIELHNIIDNHTTISYTGLWTAFYTTDDKPNGMVWDMYSDVPGGTPPYEYEFGVDQGGSAGSEGSGYNREHSWPSSWYGGSGTPYTDVFMVYPTDNEVNNRRGSYPYGEVNSPTWTSLNGCKLGPCSYPGYSGVVFEPIDEYKGDFARAYFYMSTRYYGEDGSWPGSPMVDGSQLLPWAEAMLLEWHADDPVSEKEIDRNEAVYDIQSNRNPFIDRPDFVLKMYRPELSPVPSPEILARAMLHQNVPNPFNPITKLSFDLAAAGHARLKVYDAAGRLVTTLIDRQLGVGDHDVIWDGRDDAGRISAAGVYLYRLETADEVATKRMVLVK